MLEIAGDTSEGSGILYFTWSFQAPVAIKDPDSKNNTKVYKKLYNDTKE